MQPGKQAVDQKKQSGRRRVITVWNLLRGEQTCTVTKPATYFDPTAHLKNKKLLTRIKLLHTTDDVIAAKSSELEDIQLHVITHSSGKLKPDDLQFLI